MSCSIHFLKNPIPQKHQTHDYLIGIAPQANSNCLHTRNLANTPKQITALFVREKRRSVSVGKIHAVVRCVLIA